MSEVILSEKPIISGTASRYLKPKWTKSGGISTEAFDLREGEPPETYVSLFIVNEPDTHSNLSKAKSLISGRIKDSHKGSIALLEIEEALEEVNDESTPFISFIDKKLPHCGLIYLTSAQEKIQEAKATLSLLALKKMTRVSAIPEIKRGRKPHLLKRFNK